MHVRYTIAMVIAICSLLVISYSCTSIVYMYCIYIVYAIYAVND